MLHPRVRFAPSPTGFLHIGNLRTALYNLYFAKKEGGVFVLRVEDTDRERFIPGATETLLKTLQRMGILHDEGVFLENGTLVQKGDCGPYIQSQRLEIYREQAQKLLDAGQAYFCFCSEQRLEELRAQQERSKQPSRYDGLCRALDNEQARARVQNGEAHVIRLAVPDGSTEFTDLIRGTISVPNADIDDQILLKSDGFPTYHLAVVVDDTLMKITHVIRGDDWISSAPKYALIARALGVTPPVFAHVPNILNPDRTKLSKRQGSVSVEDFLAKGYLPEALVNFVSLLGYNPRGDQEIYERQELIDGFALEKVNASGAVLDLKKLDWMNGHYIRKASIEELAGLLEPFAAKSGFPMPESKGWHRIVRVEQSRLTTLAEIETNLGLYVQEPVYEPSLLIWKKSDAPDARVQLIALRDWLTAQPESFWDDLTLLESAVLGYIEHASLPKGNVLWPLRTALSGLPASPSPFELLWALGRHKSLQRIQQAIDLLT